MKAYVASGWFSDEQESARQDIITALKIANLDFYSPKDDFLYEPGKTSPQEVFEENINQIKKSNIIVSTVGKDMGSIFESGVSFVLRKRIVYYWPRGKGKFNLMLSQTATAVFTEALPLSLYLTGAVRLGYFPIIEYKGEIE